MNLRKAIICIVCIGLCALAISCGYRDPQKYLQALNDENGSMCQKTERNGYKIRVYYRPLEYFMAKEMVDKKQPLNEDEKRKVREQYEKGCYFIVNIGPEDSIPESEKVRKDIIYSKLNDFGNYSSNLQNMLFDLKDKIFICTAKSDTVYPADYQLGRTWGTMRDNSILIAFPKDAVSFKEDALYVRDIGINIGTVVVPLGKFKNSKFKA